ncbi:MFS multidrug transporter-like protein [Usnea florida]
MSSNLAPQSVASGSTADPGVAPRQLVTFPSGDPENPRNWPTWRKWSIVIVIALIDLTVSFTASGFSPATKKFAKDFGVSSEVSTLGLSLCVLGFALGPMTLAPLSEYYGRSPIYIGSYGVFLFFVLGTALVQSLGGFLVLRFLSGWFSAVTIANFGGTIADVFEPHQTGPAMSLFLWAATAGSPFGYFLFSCIAQYKGWRDVFWALLGICGGLWLVMVATLKETRHSVLLLRRAARERRQRGTDAIEVPDSMKQSGPRTLFKIALLRPFRFLFTEAIIVFGALYNGYLYGLSFLFNGAFSLVFGMEGHGFDVLGVGLTFLGIVAGISIGPITNIWQERYYQRRIAQTNGRNVPEARVQLGRLAGITFPLSLFWFAWTTYKSVHWIVPIIASALWGWSFYTLILMTYTYTEDSYKASRLNGQVFSASALAGLGLVRNIAGAGFPLFGQQMFGKLGNQWAASLLAFLAILLVPIPFILQRHGRALRLRSPWAKQHMDDLTEEEGSCMPKDAGNDS